MIIDNNQNSVISYVFSNPCSMNHLSEHNSIVCILEIDQYRKRTVNIMFDLNLNYKTILEQQSLSSFI